MSPSGSKRSTIYFQPELHKALRLKAAETQNTISEIVNDAVQQFLAEDADDLQTLQDRIGEPTISYEAFVKELKADGKL